MYCFAVLFLQIYHRSTIALYSLAYQYRQKKFNHCPFEYIQWTHTSYCQPDGLVDADFTIIYKLNGIIVVPEWELHCLQDRKNHGTARQ